MAGWFGHTQTVASISKSVSTVAGGIIGLETNLATFMKKVIYYERFFQRVGPNLPDAMITSANRLFSRCYEYRDEIRDELESSLAYVADAGRWVIGLEDWNTKMEKRLHQINELVILANTLLVEYAMTGSYGAIGSQDELDAYLRIFNTSVVLQTDKGSAPNSTKSTASAQRSSSSLTKSIPEDKPDSSVENLVENPTNGAETPIESILEPTSDKSEEIVNDTSIVGAIVTASTTQDLDNDDEDALNPFSRSSSETASDNGEVRKRSFDSAETQSRSRNTSNDSASDSEESQATLSDYECLDKEAIPKFLAFKQSALPRRQKSRSKWSLSGRNRDGSNSPVKGSRHSAKPGPRTISTTAFNGQTSRAVQLDENRQQQLRQVMNLSASFDFQREFECNPFMSPGSLDKHVPKLATVQDDSVEESQKSHEGEDEFKESEEIDEDIEEETDKPATIPNEELLDSLQTTLLPEKNEDYAEDSNDQAQSDVEEEEPVEEGKSFEIGEETHQLDENVGSSISGNDDSSSSSSINSLEGDALDLLTKQVETEAFEPGIKIPLIMPK